jgi:hypothetical protein
VSTQGKDGIETLTFAFGRGKVIIQAASEDMAWLRPLFARHPTPFRVLRDLGYEPQARKS